MSEYNSIDCFASAEEKYKLTLSLPGSVMETFKVVLAFESVDEIL